MFKMGRLGRDYSLVIGKGWKELMIIFFKEMLSGNYGFLKGGLEELMIIFLREGREELMIVFF